MTLDDLTAITDPTEQAQACNTYLQRGRASLTAARALRDKAINTMLNAGTTPTAVAAACGVSLSHVKLVRKLHER